MITTWRKEILEVMKQNEDKDINNYVTTLTEEELDIEFHAGYGYDHCEIYEYGEN